MRNTNGNYGEGRALTLLYRDALTQRWWYLCSCCGESFEMPEGHSVQVTMMRIAGSPCARWKGRFIAAVDLWRLEWHPVHQDTDRIYYDEYNPKATLRWPRDLARGMGVIINRYAPLLAPFYEDERIVRVLMHQRDPLGAEYWQWEQRAFIRGFYGWPRHTIVNPKELDNWNDFERKKQEKFMEARRLQVEATAIVIAKPVPVDLEGFGDLAVYEPTAEAAAYDRQRQAEEAAEALRTLSAVKRQRRLAELEMEADA